MMHKDPICGMDVEEGKAIRLEFGGQTLFFCSEYCKKNVVSNSLYFKGREMRKIICSLFIMFFSISISAYAQHENMDDKNMGNMDMPDKKYQMDMPQGHNMNMLGMYGSYPATREASGTSWQPEATTMDGIHATLGEWMTMTHGFIYGIYNSQEGARGDEKFYSNSMFMFMAQRSLNEGTLGFRSMVSLDPAMGKKGYPLLLQTGETADGRTPLVDRQHPHEFISELALTYSHPIDQASSWFGYFGLPGEPALGPTAFPHRFQGPYNPEAPLTHHWLDSTHITFGVATVGYVWNNIKVEGSTFRGREPDEDRWDIEAPKFDSYSGRLTYNPTANWSFQVSGGHLDSPEQLEPHTDMNRYTTSATYNRPLENGNWQTTFAYGRNNKMPGKGTDAFLLESAINFQKTHTVFTRIERAEKDELFEQGNPLAGTYIVHKASVGYVYDFPEWNKVQWGIGSSVGVNFVPNEIESVYGKNPMSYLAFLRMRI